MNFETNEINATEVSNYFKKLDETKELRDEALSCLWDWDEFYRPNINATYYVVSDKREDLLFIRTILKKEKEGRISEFTYMEISFCRLSPKSSTIRYEWLKTAINEKILSKSIEQKINYIRAIPAPHELEVYRQLKEDTDMPIYDSKYNWITVEIKTDDKSSRQIEVIMRATKAYNDN